MTIKLKNKYEGVKLYGSELPIYLFENFINDEQCKHIIEIAKPKLKRATVSSIKTGVFSKNRSNSLTWVNKNQTSIIAEITKKIANVVGLTIEHAENLQVINYKEQQEYKAHFDAYDIDTQRGQRCLKKMGQRLITTLVYLSDVEDGGETIFPKLNLTVKPEKGSMILFHNCYLGTNKRHPNSLHQGSSVVAGEKWAFNIWFHERQSI